MKCFLRCLSVPPERFVFVAGEHVKAGDRILLNAQQSLGRLSGNDIELHSETVARRHLTISVEGAALRIEDLGSTNGTYVNGDLTRRALLKPGDRLRVAVGFEFEIELEE